jgi:hypothetical protein
VSVREPTKQAQAPLEGEAAPGSGEAALQKALHELASAPDADQPELAGRLNAALRTLPHIEGPLAAAGWLTRALETGSLGEWVDVQGGSCRATAVQVLLSLGYPYALEVSPEDLEFLRSSAAKPAPAGFMAALRPYLLYPFIAVEVSFSGSDRSQLFAWLPPVMLLHVLATVGSLHGVARTQPGSAARTGWLWLLTLSGGFGLGLSLGGILPAALTAFVTFATCLMWRRA